MTGLELRGYAESALNDIMALAEVGPVVLTNNEEMVDTRDVLVHLAMTHSEDDRESAVDDYVEEIVELARLRKFPAWRGYGVEYPR
jgi:hypothetical protein